MKKLSKKLVKKSDKIKKEDFLALLKKAVKPNMPAQNTELWITPRVKNPWVL